jgi:hypothetical protein
MVMQVLAKIESADAVECLEDILDAVDGAMVARGDLGAELPVECVPFWQSSIIQVRDWLPRHCWSNALKEFVEWRCSTALYRSLAQCCATWARILWEKYLENAERSWVCSPQTMVPTRKAAYWALASSDDACLSSMCRMALD